jgi:hypothetical protein
LEYASVVWNSITSTDSKKLERMPQKFAPVCFYRFFPNLPYNYVLASNKLNLPSLSMRRQHLDALFFIQAYRGLKSCSSLLDIVSLRVPLRNVRDFTLFSCQCGGEISRHIRNRTRLSWSYPAGLCLTLLSRHVNNII